MPAYWKRKNPKEINSKKVQSVPVLEAGDFCRGDLHDSKNDRSCLLGWLHKTFGGTDAIHNGRNVSIVVRETIEECFPGLKDRFGEPVNNIPQFNDLLIEGNGPAIPNGALAGVWNRAMAKLGFTVGNPECDKDGKLI